MKIIFDCHTPSLLAHGGAQVLIGKTMSALSSEGVEVEPLRWWDESQKADIIQIFGRASPSHIFFAHQKGMKYVMFELLTSQGSRPIWRLKLQGQMTAILKYLLPGNYKASFGWESYNTADAILASTAWEAKIMGILFKANPSKVHIVPNGVDPIFFLTPEEISTRGARLNLSKWLVCLATITERKRVVEMCEAAVAAKTPLWVIGKPYADDSYAHRFFEVVKKSEGLIRYEGAITEPTELAPILKNSRGFVLLSSMETQSVAASAAAASGCPLFLSDLPWARHSFGDGASYCPLSHDAHRAAQLLSVFYMAAIESAPPPIPPTWQDIAKQLIGIYEGILK